MPTNSCQPCKFSFLTQEQVDEFFRKYDKNGDGMITIDELTGNLPQTKNQNKVKSKAQQQPKEKAKAKANESHANAHKVKEPKKKPDDAKANEPPQNKVNSKAQQQPKEKGKAKANESHANAHKDKEPKKKPDDAKANYESPLHKVSSKANAKPAKKIQDKAQKAPAIELHEKGSIMRLSREHMKEIFREHDVDGDGFLDYGELTMAFHFLDPVLSCYKARNGIAHADANGDGLISEDELDKLIDYAQKLYGEDLVY